MSMNVKKKLNLSNLSTTMSLRDMIDLRKSSGVYAHMLKDNRKKLDIHNHIASLPFGYNQLNFSFQEMKDISMHCQIKPSLGVFPDEIYHEYLNRFMDNIDRYYHKIFLCNSGSESNELAIKLATIKHGKKNFPNYNSHDEFLLKKNMGKLVSDANVISFMGGFHGRYLGSLSTTHSKTVHKKYVPAFSNWPILNYPLEKEEEPEVLQRFEKLCSDSNTAACIIEPIQCESGDRRAGDYFYRNLRAIASNYDVTFIVDEVQTGFGATGKFWAHKYWNLNTPPDIITFGKKSRTCGLLFNTQHSILESHQLFNTWCGSGIDLIIGNHIASKINENLLKGVRENSKKFKKRFEEEIKEKYFNFRSRGYIIAFDCESTDARNKLVEELYQKDVIVNSCGEKSIRLRPSYNFTLDHFEIFLEKLKETI